MISADMMSPTTSNITASHSGAVTGRDVLTLRYNGKSDTVFFSPAPWGKLYKRTLIGNYRFPKDMIHEDQLFTSLAFYRAKSFAFCNSKLYFYRERPNSITRGAFNIKRFDNITLMNSVIDYYCTVGDEEMAKLAKLHKYRTLAIYTLYAKKNHVDIPHGMHMCPIKVLRILYKSNTAEKFEWYLSEFYPHLFSFYRTIHRIFK